MQKKGAQLEKKSDAMGQGKSAMGMGMHKEMGMHKDKGSMGMNVESADKDVDKMGMDMDKMGKDMDSSDM